MLLIKVKIMIIIIIVIYFISRGWKKLDNTQQAHNVLKASHQRRCDVLTSHRRSHDVIFYVLYLLERLRK